MRQCMTPSLRYMTIKPVAACLLSCPYCSGRQLLRSRKGPRLQIEDWQRVFAEAAALGTEYLDISGGEPSLYADLLALVWHARRHGWFVSLNSSGQGLSPDLIRELRRVCLNQIVVSLISLDHSTNDTLRGRDGALSDAMEVIRWSRAESIRVVIHFILGRPGIRSLPDLVDLAFDLDVNSLALIYPENDHEQRLLLLDESELEDVVQTVIPEAITRYYTRAPGRDTDAARIASLFDAQGQGCDFTTGQYWSGLEAGRVDCRKPYEFTLIYPNGDVLPCNGIEYAGEPIVGNVLQQPLKDIFHGPGYEAFRATRTPLLPHLPVDPPQWDRYRYTRQSTLCGAGGD